MARLLKLNEGTGGPDVLVVSRETPRPRGTDTPVELAPRPTFEARRVLFRERQDGVRIRRCGQRKGP